MIQIGWDWRRVERRDERGERKENINPEPLMSIGTEWSSS